MRKIFLLLIVSLLFAQCATSGVVVTVENNSSHDRENEMVEILWGDVQKKLPGVDGANVIVVDPSGKQMPYQLITEGGTTISKLIFPASVKAGGKTAFKIKKGVPETFSPMVYGRLVPERKDDFAWENNRVAFRIYGPALEATGEISNGLDFWAKRTDSLVIDKWYRNDLSGVASYHQDHGEGLDFYKVGRTLGLGITAPYVGDSLRLGRNFIRARIIDQGPLRLTFELKYDPYGAGGKNIDETRVISLDAYSRFNKIEQVFVVSDMAEIPVATGIVMQHSATEDEIFADEEHGIMAYELPADPTNGIIYAGVVNPLGFSEIKTAEGHLLGINHCASGTKYVYYTGGGWSKAGFENFDQWVDLLKQEENRLRNPLKVTVK